MMRPYARRRLIAFVLVVFVLAACSDSAGDVAEHLDAGTLARIAGLAQEMVVELGAPPEGGGRNRNNANRQSSD